MNTPTPEQISKLPKWAQEHIENLQRERDVAVRTLNKFRDDQSPSSIYYEECIWSGEGAGPQSKRRYVQSNRLTIEHAGVYLDILLAPEDDGQRDFGIQLVWGAGGNHLCGGYACFLPRGFQSAQIIHRDQMRVR